MPPSFLQFFGVSSPASIREAKDEKRNFNLCKTRVSRIELTHLNISLFQKGFDWVKKVKNQKESILRPVEVEKWFSKYCRIQVTPYGQSLRAFGADSADSADSIGSPRLLNAGVFEKKIIFSFVKGSPEIIYFDTQRNFLWRGQKFTSEQLEKGIKELLRLL